MEDTFVIQSTEVLLVRSKLSFISKLFNVEVDLQNDPNAGVDDIRWISIKGKATDDVKNAKAYVIALCNPELKEHMSVPGFPIFIFGAFQERVKHAVQKEFGIVLSLTDDGFIDIHGDTIGVTMAISKITYLHKLNRDRSDKAQREALQFDRHVQTVGDGYQSELLTLSNALKMEILNILEIPITDVKTTVDTAGHNGTDYLRKTIPPKVAPKVEDTSAIQVESSSQEEGSIIVLDSDEEESSEFTDDDYRSDEENGLRSDGPNDCTNALDFVLPPNFVIKDWIKIHYEGTSDPNDFVNKSDMLDHFRTHFDIADHPNLANTFFDKLAVRIFPADPNYRSVKTKKTKSKHSKRRLVCLRRKKPGDDTNNNLGVSALPVTTLPRQTVPMTSSPKNTAPYSLAMKEWNANRFGTGQSSKQMREPPKKISPSHPPHSPLISTPPPYQIIQHHPKLRQQIPPNGRPHVQQWLNTSTVRPRPAQRAPYRGMESLARRVADMSNKELIEKPRPTPNLELRPVVIDGSNVAMSHGNGNLYSCRGIAICARFFIERGHKDVTCFVPNFRKGGGGNPPSRDSQLLLDLEDKGIVKSTPSRRIGGQNIVCYDDRFIVELAELTDGVIVSNDQYRDLMASEMRWRPVIERQLLQFTMVGDLFMLPQDPLGKNGPSLDEFLKIPSTGKKIPKSKPPVHNPFATPVNMVPGLTRSPTPPGRQQMHAPVTSAWVPQHNPPLMNPNHHNPPLMNPSQHTLAYEMLKIFPNRENDIKEVIVNHPNINNIAVLMDVFLHVKDAG